jgi:hypothetical protein
MQSGSSYRQLFIFDRFVDIATDNGTVAAKPALDAFIKHHRREVVRSRKPRKPLSRQERVLTPAL